MQSTATVQLGFSEPIFDHKHWLEVAHHSPNWKIWDGGKIGGKPSWINPRDVPTSVLRCTVCSKRNKGLHCNNDDGGECNSNPNDDGTILRFLAQIYSPADAETKNEHSFHRTFYVFCCPHPLCASSENAHESVVILRGQIAQKNEFYPYDCYEEEHDENLDESNEIKDWKLHKSAAWDVNLCHICGQKAKGKCPIAKEYFCSKEHQRKYHKLMKVANEKISDDISSLTYVESELVVEEEPDEGCKDEKIENVMSKKPLFADSDDVDDDGVDDGLLEQSDLNQMTGINSIGGTSDTTTIEFYSRIGRICEDGKDVKSQCLRYNRWPMDDGSGLDGEDDAGNGPLWISSSHRPQSAQDIPNCQYCGAQRKFEFQLMPQIINFLKKKSINDKKDNEETDPSIDDSHQALLAASDLIEKAKEEGNEKDLPEGFEATQKDLVEKLKKKVFNEGAEYDDDDIDFGTISVYSCTASCGEGKPFEHDNRSQLGAYRKEFAWRQPPL